MIVIPTGVLSWSNLIIIPSRTLKRILGQIPHSFEISSTVHHVKVTGPWQTYTTYCCGWCPPGFTWCSVQSLARVSCRVMAPVSGAFGGNIVPGCTLLTWDPGVWLSSARPRRTRQKLLARPGDGVWCLCAGTQWQLSGGSFTTYAQLSAAVTRRK